ncbi:MULTISPECIES: hypothetical protein [unclassified Nostoc]|uniref:hypothetical protein n=1 Tax=unclassified Nostoc TaxID=2593658 RepID=UPI0028C37F5B|nr:MULTISPECIES: hypothetical protein [unclassified Nostoc]
MISNIAQPMLVIEDGDKVVVNPIFGCSYGDEALEFLYSTGADEDAKIASRPAIILLDLNLPGTDG